jgi:hypothetical protein
MSELEDIERDNPTVIPLAFLWRFHFAFLIGHPRHSIPSYAGAQSLPLAKTLASPSTNRPKMDIRSFGCFSITYEALESLALPLLYENLTRSAGSSGSPKWDVEVCVIDAEDLLGNPAYMVRKYCESVGIRCAGERMLP